MIEPTKFDAIYLPELSYQFLPIFYKKKSPFFFTPTWRYYFELLYHSGVLYLDTL